MELIVYIVVAVIIATLSIVVMSSESDDIALVLFFGILIGTFWPVYLVIFILVFFDKRIKESERYSYFYFTEEE